MGIAFRANGNVVHDTSTGSSATTSTFDTEVGDLIVVFVAIPLLTSTVPNVSAMSDSAGNSFSIFPNATVNNSTSVRLECWTSVASVASVNNSVTVSINSPSKFIVSASSYSGPLSTSPTSGGISTQNTANPSQSTSLFSNKNNEFVIAGFAGLGNSGLSSPNGFNSVTLVTTGAPQAVELGVQDSGALTFPATATLSYTSTDSVWAMGFIIVDPLPPSEETWRTDPLVNQAVVLQYSKSLEFVAPPKFGLLTTPPPILPPSQKISYGTTRAANFGRVF